MPTVKLDDISMDNGGEIDQLFQRWRAAIERANNWSVYGAAQFEASPTGHHLFIPSAIPGAAIARTTSAFSERTGTTLAAGTVMLRTIDQDGELTDLGEVDAWNNAMNASGPIADDSEVIVARVLGGQWIIIWVECPT